MKLIPTENMLSIPTLQMSLKGRSRSESFSWNCRIDTQKDVYIVQVSTFNDKTLIISRQRKNPPRSKTLNAW